MTNTIKLYNAAVERAVEYIRPYAKYLYLQGIPHEAHIEFEDYITDCELMDEDLDSIGWQLHKYFFADKDWLRAHGFKLDECYGYGPGICICNNKANVVITTGTIYTRLS